MGDFASAAVASVLDKHEDEADYYYDWDLGRNM